MIVPESFRLKTRDGKASNIKVEAIQLMPGLANGLEVAQWLSDYGYILITNKSRPEDPRGPSYLELSRGIYIDPSSGHLILRRSSNDEIKLEDGDWIVYLSGAVSVWKDAEFQHTFVEDD